MKYVIRDLLFTHVTEIKYTYLLTIIWLSRNKSVKKSRFSRFLKNSREFSLLDLEAF